MIFITSALNIMRAPVLGIMLMSIFVISGLGVTSAEAKNWTKAEIKQIVIEESRKSKTVSASLALAIAQVESGFRHDVISKKGAIGVMQIMPATAWGEFRIKRHQLFDPRINVRIGVQFMEQLIARYRGRVDLALSHYNGGSAVGKWPRARVIPYTRGYVTKVMAIAQRTQPPSNRLTRLAHSTARDPHQNSRQRTNKQSFFNTPEKTPAKTPAQTASTSTQKTWEEQIDIVDEWLDKTAPSAAPSSAQQDMRRSIHALNTRLVSYRERFRDHRAGRM